MSLESILLGVLLLVLVGLRILSSNSSRRSP
jgi:hypothetical protein